MWDKQVRQKAREEIQKRAKELNCLYRVDELLGRHERPLDETLRSIAEALPDGWQFPEICRGEVFLG